MRSIQDANRTKMKVLSVRAKASVRGRGKFRGRRLAWSRGLYPAQRIPESNSWTVTLGRW